MILYHGSNMAVSTPEIRPFVRALDFGSGFYTTSSLLQARNWANAVVSRRGNGVATVSCYECAQARVEELAVLTFSHANADWLDFVVNNRKLQMADSHYDLVIGPVADDNTLPTINDYLNGRFSKEIAIQLLMPQKLTDQYAFLTEKALDCLTFIGIEK